MPAPVLTQAATAAAALAHRVRRRDTELIRQLVGKVRILPTSVELTIATDVVGRLLGTAPGNNQPLTLTSSVRLSRSGMAIRLIEGGKQNAARTDPSLVRYIVQARRFWQELRKGELNITQLGEREKLSPAYITRIVRLAFLSPQVVEAILAGRQNAGVSAVPSSTGVLWSRTGLLRA